MKLFFGIFLIVNICIAFITEYNIVSLFVLMGITMFINFIAFKNTPSEKLGAVVVIWFLSLLGLVFFQAEYKFIPLSGNDWNGYEMYAMELLRTEDIITFITCNINLYPKIIAIGYMLFGQCILVPYLISYWAFVGGYVVINKILKIFEIDFAVVEKVNLIYIFTPIEIVFAVSYLREMPIQFISILVFYYCVLYTKTKNIINIVIAILFSIIASMMHSGMVVLLFMILYTIFTDNIRENYFFGILISGLLLLLLSTEIGNMMLSKFGDLSEEQLISKISYSAGNTTYVNGNIYSLYDVAEQLPIRIFMFTLSPLPWQVYNLETIVAMILTSIPQLFLFKLLFVDYFRFSALRKGTIMRIAFFVIAMLYIICALGTNNYGTAIRHRVKVYPIMICMYGLMENCLNSKRQFLK